MTSTVATLAVAAWAAGVAAAGLVLPSYLAPTPEAGAAPSVAKTVTSTQPVLAAAPLIGPKTVDGFLIMSIVAELSTPNAIDLPRYEAILHDAYVSAVLENPSEYGAQGISSFPIEAFKKELSVRIEGASGDWSVEELYLSQVNFVPRDQARSKTRLRQMAIPEN